ncbi:MAG: hypothetical protein HY647_07435 [Acidobacteria bacterium]|nr:hypothetical protein [Acidobacteriota bacterium]
MKQQIIFKVLLSLWLVNVLPICSSPIAAEARIIRIVIDRRESPTFSGMSFGNNGPFEKIIGRAVGEIDPRDPGNAVITDIKLAPRNKAGKVEYETDFYLIKPLDMKRSNGLLFYNVVNRGNKGGGFTALNLGAVGGEQSHQPRGRLCPKTWVHVPLEWMAGRCAARR